MHNEYPTDRIHFEDTIKNNYIKRCILAYGPCRPDIVFPKTTKEDGKSIHFSKFYYNKILKSGIQVPRFWLCYSVGLDSVYCETCWLFANRLYAFFNNAWINGVNDWQHLSIKIDKHEMSVQHIDACKVRVLWVNNETIDKKTERQYSEEATFWRKVLHRIIKIILHLTSGNTALRGHEQKNNNPEQFDGEGTLISN